MMETLDTHGTEIKVGDSVKRVAMSLTAMPVGTVSKVIRIEYGWGVDVVLPDGTEVNGINGEFLEIVRSNKLLLLTRVIR